MTCTCGNEFTTPFCGECGAKLTTEPLRELQAWMSAQIKQLAGEEQDLMSYTYTRRQEIEGDMFDLNKLIKQWTRWRDALAGVVERQELYKNLSDKDKSGPDVEPII